MGSSLGDIVWSLRQGVTTLEAVASRIGIHGRQLFPGTSPVFITRFPEPWPVVDVSPAVGRAVMLIALEALHNCARHARAQSVTLDLHPTRRNWVLSVFDDGVGIQSGSEGPSGSQFGFHTMQQRARDIGGSLQDALGDNALRSRMSRLMPAQPSRGTFELRYARIRYSAPMQAAAF